MAARVTDLLRAWNFRCVGPDTHRFREVRWASEGPPPCPTCQHPSNYYTTANHYGDAPAVIGDEIDIYVRHGLCHEDGTPKRYTSLQQLKSDAAEKGLCVLGDTPNPTAKFKEGRLEREEQAGKKVL